MNYLDYFNEKERDIPFTSGLESTESYLRWYDMFLQAAIERKNGVEDSKLKAPLQAAAGILGSRVMASEGKLTTGEYGLSIVNVAAEYGLYDFSFFCLLMAVAQEMDGHYALGYSALSENLPSKVPTFALAQDIYSVIADDENVFDIGRIRNTLEYCPLFTITRSVKGQGSLFDSFEASRQLTALLKGDYVLPNELSMLGGEYSGEDASKAIVYKEQVAALSNFLKALDLEAQKKMEKSELPMDTVIQIAGKRDCGYLDFIRHGIGIDKNILTMDFTLLQAMDSEKYRQVVDDYLVRARLLKDELVIVTGGSEDETAIKIYEAPPKYSLEWEQYRAEHTKGVSAMVKNFFRKMLLIKVPDMADIENDFIESLPEYKRIRREGEQQARLMKQKYNPRLDNKLMSFKIQTSAAIKSESQGHSIVKLVATKNGKDLSRYSFMFGTIANGGISGAARGGVSNPAPDSEVGVVKARQNFILPGIKLLSSKCKMGFMKRNSISKMSLKSIPRRRERHERIRKTQFW